MTTTDKMEFLEALEILFAVQEKHDGKSSTAHTRTAWHLAGAVADGLMDIECAKNLMQKIGEEIAKSNDDNYNRGYNDGYNDAEENIGVYGEDW